MANFNKVILAGNLTRDPQLSFLPNSTPVCEFGMAINRKWKGQDGQLKDDTCFVDLTVFGRQAETFNQYMSKGKPVMVEGRLKYHAWEGKDGTKRSRLTIVVESFQFLGAPGGGAPRTGTSPAPRATAPAPAAAGSYAEAPPAAYNDEPPPPMEEPPPEGDAIPF